MITGIRDFVKEQSQSLADRAGKLGERPVKAVRRATARSAERIKALRAPIRTVSRSGVKLTAISQSTAERLIEWQAQIVTSALTDAATQLERAAKAASARDILRDQADVLRATRERIVSDITEAVTILKDAGSETRKVATHTYASVTGKAEATAPRAKAKVVRKVRRAVRKAPARKK